MAIILILSFLSLLVIHTYAQNDFTVTSPEAGDTVTLSSSTSKGASIAIQWTVSDALAERPVFISLVQGNSLSSLTEIEQINSTAPNNGSYTWRGNSYDSALVYGFSHGTASGCNYSIELKVWSDVVYSSYFTIINPEDGGLNTTSQCPSGDEATSGPASRTFTSEANDGQGQASGTTSTGSASSAATTDSTAAGGGGGNGDNGSSSGVSTTTLAIAIVIPIVVLLLVFGLVIWLGTRRGWFVKKIQQGAAQENGAEKSDAAMESSAGKAMGNTGEPAFLSVRELHANDLPHQLGGSPVHELQGGEGGQRS